MLVLVGLALGNLARNAFVSFSDSVGADGRIPGQLLRSAIEQGGLSRIEAVIGAVERTGAIDYTARRAQEEALRAGEALDALPNSPCREALGALARFAVSRTY